MKIWVLSDLHLEFAPLDEPLRPPERADICVIAGDLMRYPDAGVRWIDDKLPGEMPVVYVPGNHEFYRNSVLEGIEAGRAAARESNRVHFLQNEIAEIGGVTFIGATLWTDFRLDGHAKVAMSDAKDGMNDYKRIKYSKDPWQRLLPETTARLHAESRAFIERQLEVSSSPTVVVTHHLPLRKSIHLKDHSPTLDPAYASDLSELLKDMGPMLWIHGHSHTSVDYVHARTRVVSNPRGYGTENTAFEPRLTVELDVPASSSGGSRDHQASLIKSIFGTVRQLNNQTEDRQALIATGYSMRVALNGALQDYSKRSGFRFNPFIPELQRGDHPSWVEDAVRAARAFDDAAMGTGLDLPE